MFWKIYTYTLNPVLILTAILNFSLLGFSRDNFNAVFELTDPENMPFDISQD